jgi:hypothetical protein
MLRRSINQTVYRTISSVLFHNLGALSQLNHDSRNYLCIHFITPHNRCIPVRVHSYWPVRSPTTITPLPDREISVSGSVLIPNEYDMEKKWNIPDVIVLSKHTGYHK